MTMSRHIAKLDSVEKIGLTLKSYWVSFDSQYLPVPGNPTSLKGMATSQVLLLVSIGERQRQDVRQMTTSSCRIG